MDLRFFLVVTCLYLAVNSQQCTYTSNNATYNLQPLSISTDSDRFYHLVHDADIHRNYSYYFNLCDQVHHMPLDICTNSSKRPVFAQGYCKPFSFSTELNECPPSDIIPVNDNVYAYQVNQQHQECYRLSNEVGGPIEWQLYDNNDPSAGIVIKVTNGDYSPFCKNPSRNRQIDFVFRCNPETIGMDLSNSATIIEDADKETCHYRMELSSIFGCPIQCGIYNNALCSNKGICAYDFTNNIPKCFCYSNFEGDGCQRTGDNDPKVDTTALLQVTPITPLFNINDANIQFNVANINEVIDDSQTSNKSLTGDYRYYYQFESIINPEELPESCKDAPLACDFVNDPNCANILSNDNNGIAYRVDNSDESCVLLGGINNYEISLFDEKQPAKGIRITYQGGYNSVFNANYQFQIQLECPNLSPNVQNGSNNPSIQDEVTTYAELSYSVHYITPHGCPVQCLHYNDQSQLSVCNRRGICALDPYDKVTSCICDDGFIGELCLSETQPPKEHSDNGYIVAVILLLLLLIFVSIVGIVQYVKWKQRANIAFADLARNNSTLADGLMKIPESVNIDSDEFSEDSNMINDYQKPPNAL